MTNLIKLESGQIEKIKNFNEKYKVYTLSPVKIAAKNCYDKYFVNYNELPMILSNIEIKISSSIKSGDYYKDTKKHEILVLYIFDHYYEIDIFHGDVEKYCFVDNSNNLYNFKTLAGCLELLKRIAYVESLGFIINFIEHENIKNYLDDKI